MKLSIKITIGIVFVLLMAVIQFASIYLQQRKFEQMNETQTNQLNKHLETNQFLLSTLDWSTVRQKKILFMRDEIINEWKRCGIEKLNYEKAYEISETNMKESDKYPNIDPLFLLSIQWQESRFIDTVKSNKGAIGLMQLMPPTSRLLCGFFHLSYSRSLIWHVDVNIMLGTKLVDVLLAEYEDLELVLADYNGGPYQAYYFKHKRNKLDEETKKFVPSVMKKYSTYTDNLKTYELKYKLLPSKGL